MVSFAPLFHSLFLIAYILSLHWTVATALTALTDSNIKTAAALWVNNEAQARSTYGDIADWDISQVTDLAHGKSIHTPDIWCEEISLT